MVRTTRVCPALVACARACAHVQGQEALCVSTLSRACHVLHRFEPPQALGALLAAVRMHVAGTGLALDRCAGTMHVRSSHHGRGHR